MAMVAKDRVKETTTTTGTSDLALAGAVAGFQSFGTAMANTDTCKYVLLDANGTGWEVGIGTYSTTGPTLARTTVTASSASGSKITLSAGTHSVMLTMPGPDVINAWCATQSLLPGGRLTLASATPITDTTDGGNVYYTPYIHNIMTLWNGNTWRPFIFTETSFATSGLTGSKPYDVFGYLSAGALALETVVWTSGSARATAITIQDGRYCKSGDKTRLYLGTIYTTFDGSLNVVICDSLTKRYVWNMYNRVRRKMFKNDTNAFSYNGGYQQWRNDATNQVEFVTGLDDHVVNCILWGTAVPSGGGVYGVLAQQIDTVSSNDNIAYLESPSGASELKSGVHSLYKCAAGRHYIAGIQGTISTGSVTFANMELRADSIQ